jgi:5-dehydro-2-deoxygluconokinase
MAPDLDIVCIGRAAVDLYGEQWGAGLEDVSSFAKYLGGSPANTAFGLARLGLKPAMLTRVGDEHHGRFVRQTLARAGVDVSAVKTDSERLTALAFLALRDRDTFPLLFYRRDCADMAIVPDDVDEALIRRSRAVLLSGTHGSQPGTRAACQRAIELARRHGAKVVLDIDYRPVLWGLTAPGLGENRYVANAAVTDQMQSLLARCDLVVGTDEEIRIAGGCEDTLEALRCLRAITAATLVLKRGPDGCVVYPGAIPATLDAGIVGQGFEVEVFNVLGAGDAFMAGFLRGWLRDEAWSTCCTWANACGAIVVSRHGCAPAMASFAELQHFLKRAAAHGLPRRLWADAELAHVHRATNRPLAWKPLAVFAFDHRLQLEQIADEVGARHERLPALKQLMVDAALATAAPPGMDRGVLLDDRYGHDALPRLTGTGLWVGRPVEAPGSLPLRWDHPGELASTLRSWPADHVAKCLVFWHPSQAPTLQAEQLQRLKSLQQACIDTGHEWLLELIPPRELGDPQVVSSMQQLYEAGLKPDWWKLTAADTPAEWQQRLDMIATHDPWCRGAVVLGLDAPLDLLATRFAAVPRAQPGRAGMQGFMVGRTIFGTTAREWLAGRIDDVTAREQLMQRYAQVMRAWVDTAPADPA